MTDSTSTALPGKPLAIITGAGGGMGQACARRLANTHALILTDYNEQRLEAIASTLQDEENAEIAATVAGDITSDEVIGRIIRAAGSSGRCKVLVHTAGLSPALAGWESIVRTNLVGTAKLLNAVENVLSPGFVGVVLSSTARLFVPRPGAELAEILAAPLAADLIDRIGRHLGDADEDRAANAYAYTKAWTCNAAMQLATGWAESGARIVSISPGFIRTGMTKIEVVQRPEMLTLLETTPLKRWGTVGDIANVVDFILSDKASFITGADFVIDGGLSARILNNS